MPRQPEQDPLDELHGDLHRLMRMHDPSATRADYVCAFCDERPRTNASEIEHEPTCLGVRCLARLASAHAQRGVRIVITIDNIPPDRVAGLAAASLGLAGAQLAREGDAPAPVAVAAVPVDDAVGWSLQPVAAPNCLKIQAIKAVRELVGCGLKEAKDVVDAAQGHPWPEALWARTRPGVDAATDLLSGTGVTVRATPRGKQPVGLYALLAQHEGR